MNFHAVIDSPIGPLTLTGRPGILTGVQMDNQAHARAIAPGSVEDHSVFADAISQFGEYFSGDRLGFDLACEAAGTEFQVAVWHGLAEIPYGQTWSYGRLADRVGRPKAVRAVGLANGRNPHAIVVPCHRVIGADGSLTGYGGGLDRKIFLLDLEEKVLSMRSS